MKSIALKLWAGMMLLVVIVLVFLWLFQIVFLENFYVNQRIAEVKNKGISLIKDIDQFENDELKNKLDSFVYDYNCSISLIDSNRNTIYNNEPNRQMPMMGGGHIKGSIVNEVLSGNTVTAPVTHPRFNSSYMLIGLPIKADESISGALLINMPLAPVKDTASILKKQLIYICILLFFTALLLSFLLSKSFINPILTITKATDKMVSGNLSVRLETKSKDEIGRLANTINRLGVELTKTEQLRRDFIANVSHELRTPLSLIRGYAETIRDVSGGNEEKRRKQLEIIIEESERLGKMVDDILDLSQIQSGNMVINKSNFDLSKTIQSVINKYKLLSEHLKITIIYESKGSAVVRGDEERIEQVLYNLINNAFNYSSSGDSILVTITDINPKIRVSVSDTGEGIPPEEIKHIWERYYKANKYNSKKRIGTGLGLNIVKNILESHETKYGVESIAGKGTTFWFELDSLK